MHFNGKRRQHRFRALYDFYDKRVDYGDAEFPSRWPSEVEQDDMIGWRLRIGEDFNRPPDEACGDWQRYDDAESGRSFFYNAITQEGCYDEPPEWRMALAAQASSSGSGAEETSFDETQTVRDGGGPGTGATWTAFLEDGTGLTYFVNDETGEVMYQQPQELGGAPDSPWSRHYDPVYQVDYFYNELSGEATYGLP